MKGFIQSVVLEFNRVQWPTKEQTIRLTGYVIGVSLSVGMFVTGIDYVFKEILNLIVGK